MSSKILGQNQGQCQKLITDINVTPLVDIMLVLLIIFMVTATFIVRDSLEVHLPEASTGESRKVTLLAITIAKNGQLSLNGVPKQESEIRAFIRQKRSQKMSLETVIAADKDVSHGRVVHIIDLARSEGVTKFLLNVLKPQK
ncbi:MAG: biopolymer transporter ExbD [Pseudomonadota bacterium]